MRAAALVFLLASVAFAEDTVYLKGGATMRGTVRLEDEKAYLNIGGGEAELAIADIEKIEWDAKSPELRKLKKQYAKMEDGALERARWAVKFGLKKEAKKAWEEVLADDPENEEALKALKKKKPSRKKPKKKASPKKAGPVVKSAPVAWAEVANGLTLRTEHFEIRGDLPRERLIELAALIEKMNVFHREHFGTDLGNEWKVTLIQKQADFIAYSKKIGSKQYGGGGYCEWNTKEFVGRGDSGHTWETLIKHELGHAYYRTAGPFWLREGAAVLVEGLEWERGKPVIKVPAHRLKQIKQYWKAGKHKDLRCCTLKPVFPIAYCHHWAFHYYVWVKKGKDFYRKMLKDLQGTKEKDDLTDRVVKMLGMETLEALEKDWKAFIEGLK